MPKAVHIKSMSLTSMSSIFDTPELKQAEIIDEDPAPVSPFS
jgi:hypothetical protein